MKWVKNRWVTMILIVLIVFGAVFLKCYYGHLIAKKHMPNITFWEYYWALSR